MNGMLKMFGMMKDFARFKKDPMGALSSRFNIPQGMDINNTEAIAQHLVNTKQVPQNNLSEAVQTVNMMMS